MRTRILLFLGAVFFSIPTFAQGWYPVFDFQSLDGIYYRFDSSADFAVKVSNKYCVQYPSGDYDYWRNTYAGDIVIPSTVTYGGNEYTVIGIDDGAFYYCNELTSVTLPHTIKEIGSKAFNGTGITSITLPDELQYIGNDAFAQCFCIQSITLPESIKGIGTGAFSYCPELMTINIDSNNTKFKSIDGVLYHNISNNNYELLACPGAKGSIDIPGNVTKIAEKAFAGCQKLSGIRFPDDLTSVGAYALSACYQLTDITLPEGIKSIAEGTFSECYALESIKLPSDLRVISEYAFRWCTSLTSIDMPALVNTFTKVPIPHIFMRCDNLKAVNFDTASKNYTTIDGVVYSKDETSLLYCPGGKTSVTIPNMVSVIGEEAFGYCSHLRDIDIPNSVTEIADLAFLGCHNLESIYIPESVNKILGDPFNACNNLKSIVCNIEVPVVITTELFCQAVDKEKCVLHVPEGSVEAYRAAPVWNQFVNIVGDAAGINEATIGAEEQPADVYDLRGICVRRNATDLNGLAPGIYIHKGRKVRI